LDGYDEISLTGEAKIISKTTENILHPKHLNLSKLQFEDIKGGATIEKSATLFMNIINGNGTEAQQNVVCANAAMAISIVENMPLLDAFAIAKESLEAGKASEKLKKLQQISQAS
jgi:anthranilate phosphoribosyltransferase